MIRPDGELACPLPVPDAGDRVCLAHGEGGRASRQLIQEIIIPRLGNKTLNVLGDAAQIVGASTSLAFTTDAYTVSPLFFPGGDIGRLSVFGTVNDLAVSGAIPRWLSLSLIIEEGFSLSQLDEILDSIRTAADLAQVAVVTGDTKVVPRGTADGLYIVTAGIGELTLSPPPGPSFLEAGDELIVSGPLGRHGAAILCAREQLDFTPPPESDCASLAEPLLALLRAGLTPRAMRDATRGGVSAVLHEWMSVSQLSCTIDEKQLPESDVVRGVAELLGLDPLHLANEGTFVIATTRELVSPTLILLHQFETTCQAARIGHILPRRPSAVSIVRRSGREVPVTEPVGMPLPRIC